MQRTALKNYAKLLARTGLNVQKGQEVIIAAEADQEDFVALVAEECYRAGAANVRAEWGYQPLRRLAALNESETVLGTVAAWEEEKLRCETRTLPARLYLESEDPGGMAGIDAAKYARSLAMRSQIIKPYRDRMENRYQWCIAAVPGREWAKKVFPRVPASAAEEKLWLAILRCARALEGSPVANWQAHNARLAARCEKLNALGLAALEYEAGNGTRLRVGLLADGLFLGGEEETLAGVKFNPNIPSEEIYTTPMRGEAEGIVYSTKPLSYRGQLIRNFSLRFEGGRVVEAHAAAGEAVLKRILGMDEGAAYLGECALVPYDSPVSNTGALFYNTLFDENASCHLALGRGFNNCVAGWEGYSFEEIKEKGVNDSSVHVDFMIGTDDLCITGVTKDGRRIPVFENGNWSEQF